MVVVQKSMILAGNCILRKAAYKVDSWLPPKNLNLRVFPLFPKKRVAHSFGCVNNMICVQHLLSFGSLELGSILEARGIYMTITNKNDCTELLRYLFCRQNLTFVTV